MTGKTLKFRREHLLPEFGGGEATPERLELQRKVLKASIALIPKGSRCDRVLIRTSVSGKKLTAMIRKSNSYADMEAFARICVFNFLVTGLWVGDAVQDDAIELQKLQRERNAGKG